MKTIKTIQQLTTTYTISQFGNRSFRVSFLRQGDMRVQHIAKVFDALEEAEEYIRQCSNMDKIVAMATK